MTMEVTFLGNGRLDATVRHKGKLLGVLEQRKDKTTAMGPEVAAKDVGTAGFRRKQELLRLVGRRLRVAFART